MDIEHSRGHSEFRIPPLFDHIVKRDCSIRLAPDGLVACEYKWSSDSGVSLNNILGSTLDLKFDMWRLIKSSEKLTFNWTDTIRRPSSQFIDVKRYRIVVPTSGLTEVEERLNSQGTSVFISAMNTSI